MTERYELPILFTEEERNTYAAWGIKKEKVLMPFAIATILIYVVTAAFVVMKVWGVRDSDHVLFQMLCVTPERRTVKVAVREERDGESRTPVEIHPLSDLSDFLNPRDNTVYYHRKWYRIGENTIENIYPQEKRHSWMDHPENKASGIIDVQRLMGILKGYEASLKAARKECEWMEKHGG